MTASMATEPVSRDPTAVKQAVGAVASLVRSRADETEGERRLPDEIVVALGHTGVHRLALPAALGGLEAPVIDIVEVIEELATVDGSTAWCTAIGAGSNLFAGYITEAAARVVFRDPDQGNATMFAPYGEVVRVDGRNVLTGRWPFSSNCLHSVWIGLGAHVGGEDEVIDPVPRLIFVPVDDVTIEDTWYALGLRGTGSHHTSVRDLVVDMDLSCRFPPEQPWAEGTLWRLPLYTVLLPMLSAVPLGIARGALDEITRQAREGRCARRDQLTDDPISLAELAEADTVLRAARAAVLETVAEAHLRAEQGDPIDRRLQARLYLACLHACDASVEATSVAHNLAGGGAVYIESALQRALRDVETARQHLVFSHQHRAEFAKALVDTDVVYPPFITPVATVFGSVPRPVVGDACSTRDRSTGGALP
jgi:indole-3-acetate monooxygenase